MTPPSHLAYVPFISVENMMRLIHSIGIETMLKELADAIEHDFTRWPLFDKTPRVGSIPRSA
jgi:ornithine cyclodeaminase